MSLTITTAIGLVIISAVATSSGIIFDADVEDISGIKGITAFNHILQSVYLSNPGTTLTFLWPWCGHEVELVCEGNKTNAVIQVANSGHGWVDIFIPDPASIIDEISYNETHLRITYKLIINNYTAYNAPAMVTFSRLQGGILIAANR
ncbi:MAG: hypothetical protein QFX34_02995 [Candidatus Verstraetearchaeota archaeon]|nr:hypothetical protein [Candidatus Verstraetearchaeota archaeon]